MASDRNILELCRLCLSDSHLVSFESNEIADRDLLRKIWLNFRFHIVAIPGSPEPHVCKICIGLVEAFFAYFTRVIENQSFYENLVGQWEEAGFYKYATDEAAKETQRQAVKAAATIVANEKVVALKANETVTEPPAIKNEDGESTRSINGDIEPAMDALVNGEVMTTLMLRRASTSPFATPIKPSELLLGLQNTRPCNKALPLTPPSFHRVPVPYVRLIEADDDSPSIALAYTEKPSSDEATADASAELSMCNETVQPNEIETTPVVITDVTRKRGHNDEDALIHDDKDDEDDNPAKKSKSIDRPQPSSSSTSAHNDDSAPPSAINPLSSNETPKSSRKPTKKRKLNYPVLNAVKPKPQRPSVLCDTIISPPISLADDATATDLHPTFGGHGSAFYNYSEKRDLLGENIDVITINVITIKGEPPDIDSKASAGSGTDTQKARLKRGRRPKPIDTSQPDSPRTVLRKKLDGMMPENLQIKTDRHSNDVRIKMFYQLVCPYCVVPPDMTPFGYETFKEVMVHCETAHQQTGYIVCCNRKLFRKDRLLTHMTLHENPDAFKCLDCGHKSQSKSLLRIHMKVHLPTQDGGVRRAGKERRGRPPVSKTNAESNIYPLEVPLVAAIDLKEEPIKMDEMQPLDLAQPPTTEEIRTAPPADIKPEISEMMGTWTEGLYFPPLQETRSEYVLQVKTESLPAETTLADSAVAAEVKQDVPLVPPTNEQLSASNKRKRPRPSRSKAAMAAAKATKSSSAPNQPQPVMRPPPERREPSANRCRANIKRPPDEKQELGLGQFQCTRCDMKFEMKSQLTSHMVNVHNANKLNPYECGQCDEAFEEVDVLRAHELSVHGKYSTHICSTCKKEFSIYRSLYAHIRNVHLQVKNFPCTLCDKRFRRTLELTEHMAKHTGEVLYTCPYCPRTFGTRSNYIIHHKKLHPNEQMASIANILDTASEAARTINATHLAWAKKNVVGAPSTAASDEKLSATATTSTIISDTPMNPLIASDLYDLLSSTINEVAMNASALPADSADGDGDGNGEERQSPPKSLPSPDVRKPVTCTVVSGSMNNGNNVSATISVGVAAATQPTSIIKASPNNIDIDDIETQIDTHVVGDLPAQFRNKFDDNVVHDEAKVAAADLPIKNSAAATTVNNVVNADEVKQEDENSENINGNVGAA